MNSFSFYLIICSMVALSVCTSTAGLTNGTTVVLFKGETPEALPDVQLSVYPGKAYYQTSELSSSSGMIGDGDLLDYRLFNGKNAYDGSKLNTYADGRVGLIGDATVQHHNRTGEGFLSVWTENDPGPSFSTAPDIRGDKTIDSLTSEVGQDITGQIDISKIDSGSIYLIYGSFLDSTTVTVTMSGPGQPDITSIHTEPHGTSRINWWMSPFNFTDAEQYDTITYHYENADIDGSRAHFIGVLLDAEIQLDTLGLIIASAGSL